MEARRLYIAPMDAVRQPRLASGMVLEIETGSADAIRRTKGLVTRASKELGRPFHHWHDGTKVFAKPVEAVRRRGRPPKNRA